MGIVLASPAELSRLGVWEARKLAVLAMLALGSFLLFVNPTLPPSEARFFSGIDSPEFGLDVGVGGTGKEPMLVTLRTDLVGGGIPEARPVEEADLGISLVDCDCGVGRADGRDGVFSRVGVACARLLRMLFGCGMGGSAPVGGSAAGRARTGRDMLCVSSSLPWSVNESTTV